MGENEVLRAIKEICRIFKDKGELLFPVLRQMQDSINAKNSNLNIKCIKRYLEKNKIKPIIVACCSTYGIERYADERIISHSGLFFENQGPIKIMTTKWNLVAFYDISSFRERTKVINAFMETTNSVCDHLRKHRISQTNCETNFALSKLLFYTAEEKKRGIPYKTIAKAAQILFGICDRFCIQRTNTVVNKLTDKLYITETDILFDVIQAAKVGLIHPSLLTPKELLKQLLNIKIRMPSGTDLPIDLNETVSKSKEMYSVYDEIDQNLCKYVGDFLLCPEIYPLHPRSGRLICELLLLQEPNEVPNSCELMQVQLRANLLHKLKFKNEWIYATPGETIFITCDQDKRNDIDFKPEAVEEDDHNSESEEEMYDRMDDDIDEDIQDMEGLTFYIGRNNDTIWANKQLSKTSKVRSKNINKNIPGPKA
ncbi:Envelope fusion protein [Aphis craccivora]|uniref:Envelope fusion protein n=1 Tax=Aphis craccivora TaxID=307492 RepID=A0A6G0W7B4_APHCR|nr:Envelope fusion protein [Aphis craccivora]